MKYITVKGLMNKDYVIEEDTKKVYWLQDRYRVFNEEVFVTLQPTYIGSYKLINLSRLFFLNI